MPSSMELIEVGKITINADGTGFESAMKVWLTKPQVVSRRLCGSVMCKTSKVNFFPVCKRRKVFDESTKRTDSILSGPLEALYTRDSDWKGTEFHPDNDLSSDTEETSILAKTLTNNLINRIIPMASETLEQMFPVPQNQIKNLEEKQQTVTESETPHVTLLMRKLLPRQCQKLNALMELILVFYNGEQPLCYLFVPLQQSNVFGDNKGNYEYLGSYAITYTCGADDNGGSISLMVNNSSLLSTDCLAKTLIASPQWLETCLLPKLKSWAEQNTNQSDSPTVTQVALNSLSLISIEEYNAFYNQLKVKYSDHLMKIWTENTDPEKFIFEDIGIATYLILTWKRLSHSKPVTFVDVGCGNGLLVYLLTQEGHNGMGIDIRKRKIWEYFKETTNLKEISLLPYEVIFEVDWIIGNHSDELTPWIPIIAARSAANYFNLPCCFYTFQGKFQRGKSRGTQYNQYLEFIGNIGRSCGYTIEVDKLRIPSTKKICQIGFKDKGFCRPSESFLDDLLTLNSCDTMLIEAVRISTTTPLQLESSMLRQESNNSSSSGKFVPRESAITVKNCTKVDIRIRDTIVDTVFKRVLYADPMRNVSLQRTNITSKGFPCKEWNAGGFVPLEEIVGLFDSSCLSQLKSQCGGIKTLLRNYSHIFRVVQGLVSLKCYAETSTVAPGKKAWQSKKLSRKEHYRKTKPCYFDNNHPQGCVLMAAECDFLHCEE